MDSRLPTMPCMSRVTRHLRVGIATVLLLLLSFLPLQATAGEAGENAPGEDVFTPQIIMTEFQTNGGAAAQEFVELHNTTDADIILGDGKTVGDYWKLQFFGSSAIKDGQPIWTTNPTNTFILKGTLPARGYMVISTLGYMPAGIEVATDQHYGTANSNFLTDAGGALRLLHINAGQELVQTTHDQLAWLDPAKNPAGDVLITPGKGLSHQRHPFDDDTYIDGQGVLAAFGDATSITPFEALLPPPPPEAPVTEIEEPTVVDPLVPSPAAPALPSSNDGLLPPEVTELLPNPAAPARDETDEYIELHNPNPLPFNLKGYTLQTGLTTLREFTFSEDVLLPAGSYQAFYASETRLSLTNTGSQVRLLNPMEAVLNESLPYTAASEGLVWALDNGMWQWSATATAGQANVITAAAAGTSAAQAVMTKTATTKTRAPKAATKKVAAAKPKGTTKTKAAKAKKTKVNKAAKPKTAAVAHTTEKPPRAPIHTGVLVAVVTIAVLYAAYEYRHDIANRFYNLRGNRTVRAYARQ